MLLNLFFSSVLTLHFLATHSVKVFCSAKGTRHRAPRSQKIHFFLLIFFCVLDLFGALISKIILKKKNVILIHFDTKNTLKSNRNHTPKHVELLLDLDFFLLSIYFCFWIIILKNILF